MVLFVDTFTNNFEPEMLHAARRVLRAAGYRVAVAWPDARRAGAVLRPHLPRDRPGRRRPRREARAADAGAAAASSQGVPIVGLEPSCLFTLRDEFLALGLGEDAQAVCDNAFLFEEFLAREKKAGRLDARR